VRVLLIDNFDSFVYNLAQAFGGLGADPVVIRNTARLEDLDAIDPDAVVVSPGPGTPAESGVSIDAIRHFGDRVPVLGVCLGHQCVGAAFGGRVDRATVGPVHGKTSNVSHDGRGIFQDVSSPFIATRYHSLSIHEEPVAADLEVSAHSEDGTIMAVRHRALPIDGVQFHPESVLTEEGPKLLQNFLSRAKDRSPAAS
jgi:anthranilate synthase/aminodeoxychorismate synthase-like glutamine amidotransferase